MKSRLNPIVREETREMRKSFRTKYPCFCFARFRNVVCTELYKTVHSAGENDNARTLFPPEKRKHRVGHLPLIFVRTNREVNEACREASSLFDSTFRSNNNWQPASILEQGEASVQRIESRIGTIQRIAPLNRVIF